MSKKNRHVKLSEQSDIDKAIFRAAILAILVFGFGALLIYSDLVSTQAPLLPVSFALLVSQDMAVCVALVALYFLATRAGISERLAVPDVNGARFWIVVALSMAAVVALRWLAHCNYDLSLDEFMPSFQAQIFRNGDLLAQLEPDDYHLSPLLQPFFTYTDSERLLWASHYRPVHAMLLSLFPAEFATAALNAILVGAALVAMAALARRAFPEQPTAPVLAVLLLLSTPQFLITASSNFSFTAHLSLNAIWLALFLRQTWASHSLAAVVGFFAIGLHQVHVHPLFAAPFFAAMVFGQFGGIARLLPYVISYSVALPLWIAWPEIATWLQTGDRSALPSSVLEVNYIANYLKHSGDFGDIFGPLRNIFLGTNIGRFAVWLSPGLLPLLVLGYLRFRHLGLFPLLCLASLLLTIAFTYLAMPNQSHTWGSRYYHPILPAVVILGMASLYSIDAPRLETATRTVFILCLAGIVLFVPWRAWQVYQKVQPRAEALAAIKAIDEDYLVIDARGWFMVDFVQNDPYLQNRPRLLFFFDPDVVDRAPPNTPVFDYEALVATGFPSGTLLEPDFSLDAMQRNAETSDASK